MTDKSDPPPLGVAVWGIGRHARRTALPALGSCESLRLVGLHSRDQDILGAEAAKYGCLAFDTPDAMLADKSVRAVYIATPVAEHRDPVARALEAGKHVWCEKPITGGRVETMALSRIAESRGLSLMECTMFVYHPQFAALRGILDSGRIGALKSITARYAYPHRETGDFRYDPMAGGGALFDAGFLALALPVHLLGRAADAVMGVMERTKPYHVDTGGGAVMTFAGGVQAIAEWGFGRHPVNEAHLWGDRGMVRVTGAFAKPAGLETAISLETADGTQTIAVAAADQTALMFASFAAASRDLAHAQTQARLSQAVAGAMDAVKAARVRY